MHGVPTNNVAAFKTCFKPLFFLEEINVKLRITVLAAAVTMMLGASAQAAKTTLTVAAFPAVDQIVKDAKPFFEKKYPNVEIKVIGREFSDHHSSMITALATNSGLPDVMAVEFQFVSRFIEGGGVEDLSKAPYNANSLKDKYLSYALPQATSDTGLVGAVPTDVGPGTMFYRKDIVIDKAGVSEADLIKSWDSYVESGKKIKAKTGSYLLAHARDMKDIMIRVNLQPGEGIYFDKDHKVLVDGPRFVRAFTMSKTVRDNNLDGKIGAWGSEWSEGFKRGTFATQMMGAWLGGHLAGSLAPNTKGLWRAAPLPENALASYGGTFYAIPKKSNQKELAWEFIKFMTLDKDQQLRAFKSQDAFPALISAQNDTFFEQPIDFLGGQKARLVWRDIANRIPAIEVDRYDQLAAEMTNTALDEVLDEGKDINEALAKATKYVKKRARR
jgi:multiple sugar transport system substrate-binding protein